MNVYIVEELDLAEPGDFWRPIFGTFALTKTEAKESATGARQYFREVASSG